MGGSTLDPRSDRLDSLQYWNGGTYQALVGSHTANVGGRAGIRWFELRDSGSGWALHQEGTFATSTYDRWMSSIATNQDGDIALGYTESSNSLFPSLPLEAFMLFLDYLFTVFGFRKLYGEVLEFNLTSFRSIIGKIAHEEGRLRDHEYFDGRYWDLVFLAIYREEWEAKRERLGSGGLRMRAAATAEEPAQPE